MLQYLPFCLPPRSRLPRERALPEPLEPLPPAPELHFLLVPLLLHQLEQLFPPPPLQASLLHHHLSVPLPPPLPLVQLALRQPLLPQQRVPQPPLRLLLLLLQTQLRELLLLQREPLPRLLQQLP